MSLDVLFIAPSAYRLGGTQAWLDYLLPGLRDAGCTVTLGLTAGRFHDVDAYLREHPFDHCVRIAAPTGSRQGRVAALARTIAAQAPDLVVVLNIVDSYEAMARLRQAGDTSTRLVATLHGLQPDFLDDFTLFAAQLDTVVCSNRLARALVRRQCPLPAERVLYAPYGVQLPASPPPRQREPGAPLRLAYSGRLESEQKRVHDLPAILAGAVRAGIDVTLDIAGLGPEEHALRRAIDAAGVTGRVHFRGVLDEATLRERVYRHCDALLLTSSWETGPIVAWEALSEGMVLISSDYLGRRAEGSLVHDENCLVFPTGDVDAAVACIARLASPDTCARLAAAGRALVAARYSRVHSISAWHECLRSVHHMPRLPPASPPQPGPARGRLDTALGTRAGEAVRRLLGVKYEHADPGGEWPHTRSGLAAGDPRFWALARTVDAAAETSP